MNKTVLKEKIMEIVFLLCACVSILAVALICIFLFANGIPAMAKIGLFDFLLGKMWKPSNDIYGIFPMILGSIYWGILMLLTIFSGAGTGSGAKGAFLTLLSSVQHGFIK
mgnify:CR=1 FL=1